MDRPRVRVDFNEIVEPDLALLAQSDEVVDSAGSLLRLAEGLAIHIYTEDPGDNSEPDALIADGTVERNVFGGWTSAAKWNCRIDARGIRRWPQEG